MDESQYDQSSIAGLIGIFFLFYLAILAFYGFCMWKIFVKAGKPGWAAIIPIYNFIVLLEIVGKPAWWIILILIPFVNFIILIIILNLFSKSFGKDIGMTLLLIFLSFIAIPILAFGDARYVGPAGLSKAI